MIYGTGCDIIEISRIEKAIKRTSFLQRVFTEKEIETYNMRGNNPAVLAGYFASKEAFVKALGTGFRGIYPKDIEIVNDKAGKPYINCAATQDYTVHLSVSHSQTNAIAYVIIEKNI